MLTEKLLSQLRMQQINEQAWAVRQFIDLLHSKLTEFKVIKIFSEPETLGCLATFWGECVFTYSCIYSIRKHNITSLEKYAFAMCSEVH